MTFINHRSLVSARSTMLGVLMCAFTAVILSSSAFAGEAASKIDSSMSVARLYGPDSASGVAARVVGTVKLDRDHPDQSKVELCIYPADEEWSHSLTPNGSLPSDYVPDATDHTLLTFRSDRVVNAAGGQLRAEGDLTLTRVERDVTVNGSGGGEGYFGPVEGEPMLRKVTRRATFVFPAPAARNQRAASSVSASAEIDRKDFEELRVAIADTNWPSVVANETCDVSSTVGEDYSGSNCRGPVIAPASTETCDVGAGAGEGYSGPVCAPSSNDRTMIVLRLMLTNAVSR